MATRQQPAPTEAGVSGSTGDVGRTLDPDKRSPGEATIAARWDGTETRPLGPTAERVAWRSALRVGLGILALVYALGLAGLWARVAANVDRDGWTALLQELVHFWFLPLPSLLLVALVLRARLALAALLLPLLLFGALYGPQFVPAVPAAAVGPPFRVLSFNVGAARGFGRPELVLSAVRAADPDVVCLVEARADSLETLGVALHDTHPY
jgi:hypothetical protein